MEYVEGTSVRDVLIQASEQKKPMPWPLVAWLGARACEGLAHAHALLDEQGKPVDLVHRDISPHNLLVSFDGMVKLVDFGIARATIRIEQTQSYSRKGKLRYMSPEQVMGMPLDQRSDLFSLGVVLWELLANARLFDGSGEMGVMQQITSGTVPDPAAPESPVAEAMVAAVKKALALEPDDRFANATDLGEALEEALAREKERTPNAKRLAEYLAGLFGEDVSRAREEVSNLLSLDVNQEASSALEAEAQAQSGGEADTEELGPLPGKARTRAGLGTFVYGFGGALLAILVMLGLVFSGMLTATQQATPTDPVPPPQTDPATKSKVAVVTTPAKRKAKATPAGPAKLTVSSTPSGAAVVLDGKLLTGRTPLTVERPPGRYRVEAARDGYFTAKQTVRLRGGVVRDVQLALKAKPKPMGRLTFNTKPWSIVWIGSRKFETPLFKEKLPAGKHTLRVLREGKGPAIEVKVTIPAGDELTLPTKNL